MSQKQFRLFIATLLLCTAALVFAILFLASYVHWAATVQTGQWLDDNKALSFSLFPVCVMCVSQKEATAVICGSFFLR